MTIDRASDNPFPSVLLVEGDPEALAANPAAGQRRLAVGLDHLLYLVDDAGVATEVGALPTADDVAVTPFGTIAATNVQDALEEIVAEAAGFVDPMTTRGDMIVRNASNVTARLGRGSAGTVLGSDGTDLAWVSAPTPAFVGCRVVKTSGFSHSSSGSFMAITFDATDVTDTNGYHDPSTNNTRITIPSGKAGKYWIHGAIEWDANTTGGDRGLQVWLNNATEIGWDRIVPGGNGSTQQVSLVYTLAVNDYLELKAFQNSGRTRTIAARATTSPVFEVIYLGA